MSKQTKALERALGYPYHIEATSYVLDNHVIKAWPDDLDLKGRTPVLACGSNQSPVQLCRKFKKGGFIPVMAGWLSGFDSVYSAHVTSYGSIAAMYVPVSHQTRSRQFITWLDDDQLHIMHQTESLGVNYDFEQLDNLSFIADDGALISTAYHYQGRKGCLLSNNTPISLSAIKATGRKNRSMDQSDIQKHLINTLDLSISLEAFILKNISEPEHRSWITQQLSHLT